MSTGAKENCVQIDGISAGRDSACVLITSNEGISDTTIIYILVTMDCAYLFADSLYRLQLDKCDDHAQICLNGFALRDSSRYSFFTDGQPYLDVVLPCDKKNILGISYQNLYDSKTDELLAFPFSVDGWTVNGTVFPPPGQSGTVVGSLQDIVDLLNQWDASGNWQLDTLHRYFVGGNSLSIYGDLQLVNISTFSTHNAPYAVSEVFDGLSFKFGRGSRLFSVIDNVTGCKDQAIVAASCASAKTEFSEIEINSSDSICVNLSPLPGKIVHISNESKLGHHVNFIPSADKNCVRFYGKKPGKDTAVIVVCDEYNFCDTTILIVRVKSVINNFELDDTIFTNESRKICFDSLLYGSGVRSFVSDAQRSGSSVLFSADAQNFCLNYTSTNAAGVDTARIIRCNSHNFCDTTTLYVTVKARKAPLHVFKETIVLFNAGSICLPKNKFGIPLSTPFILKNICD